jgi:uncharacterized Tic20 family protein
MNNDLSAAGEQYEPDLEQQSDTDGKEQRSRSLRIQLIVFCALLVLAMIGMGLTESREDGGWEYWIFLILVYGSASVALAWRQAKQRAEPVWQMIRKQVLHWFGALITLKTLFLLERTDVISREAASDASVIILALVCYLAGVHFQWAFFLIGLFVGIMAITLAYAEQYTVWLILIPAAAGIIWLYVKLRATRSDR